MSPARDVNDDLYSKIIRFGVEHCLRCRRRRPLECAHIFGRGNLWTRFQLTPVKNAVPLCFDCHAWFDTHKDTNLITDPEKRVKTAEEESFTFLVWLGSYAWADIEQLYAASQKLSKYYSSHKKEITVQLKYQLNQLEAAAGDAMTL